MHAQMASLLKLAMKKFYNNCSALVLLYFTCRGKQKKIILSFKKFQSISPYIKISLFGSNGKFSSTNMPFLSDYQIWPFGSKVCG
jgi:hypothetical protein